MCSTSCIIEIKDTKESYRPGEIITGRVILDINCSNYILLKALSLQFSGYAYTKWEKFSRQRKSDRPQSKALLEYREDYVSATSYLIGSDMANAKRLESGEYTFNFLINIPPDIPSTFDSSLGFIHYELTVHADYGDHTKPLSHIPIVIEQIKDLRQLDPSVQLPVEKEQQEITNSIKFWQQPLQLYIGIPQKAFVIGECISLHIKVANHSKLKLQAINSNLNRIVTYKYLKREGKSESTTDISTIAANCHSLCGQNSHKLQLLSEIVVPKTPPTITYQECKCINLSYELEVLVHAENKQRCVRAILPILIGTVSLRSNAKILPSNLSNKNVAAIRVAQSLEDLTLPYAIDLQDNLRDTQIGNISMSTASLASSFQEANFMAAVKLKKKSKTQIAGNLSNFKPKYLYYDATNGVPCNFPNDVS